MPPVPHTSAAVAEDHAALIVALDGGDLAGAERGRAEALVESCAGCAALRADLAAIRGAMASLPVPPRRRDFQLSPEDAARFRPTAWRRLLGWLVAPGSTVRPLATGLATLGVVGLLLTAGLPGLGGGATTLSTVGTPAEVPAPDGGGVEGYGAAASPEVQPAALPTAAPSAAGLAGTSGDAAASPAVPERNATTGATDQMAGKGIDEATATGSGPPLALILSGVLLAAGLALFVARGLALRRAD